MPDFGYKDSFEEHSSQDKPFSKDLDLSLDKDLVMEQILENISTTPIGQVLKKIASLPEVRKEKVLDVRRRLTEGKYELNERLDIALEKVLGDLTA